MLRPAPEHVREVWERCCRGNTAGAVGRPRVSWTAGPVRQACAGRCHPRNL